MIDRDEEDEGNMWQLTGMEIEMVRVYKYLVVTLANSGLEKAKSDEATEARQW